MRLAYFSPLPPARSGIADYSAELVPALAEHLEIELFVDEGVRTDEALTSRFTVRGDRAFPALWESGRYDAVVYHVGNNPDFHTRTWKMLQRIPGIVILHEYMLHHLVRGMTLAKGDLDGYVEEMRYAYGRTGEALARRSVGTGIPLDVWSYPLFERVVDASLGLIVHNDCTGDRVRSSRPGTRIVTIPHHLSLRELDSMSVTSPEQARATLGIPADAFVVASFGFVTPAKRIDVALRAFARLKREVPRAVYLLVGEVSPHYDFASLLTPALSDGVTVVGHTELDRFLLHMLAADVTVNLRYPSAGETSGTLIRLLGLGKPVIVSNTGAFSEIPDDCCARIDLDDSEEELLAAVLLRLAADEPLRRRMGENARAHIATRHTLEGSARGYADFVREIVAARPRPFRPVPPLAPAPPEDVFSDLVAAVASEAADLGVGEEDTELLGELAAVLAEWRTG
ncbi:MAG TPA: glycosyltransferase family 4 protein [Thermoanaerobaculia bacterium]|nr:glycosyltransferase family 4 protein [Thermoanaerobaculia bacterium]